MTSQTILPDTFNALRGCNGSRSRTRIAGAPIRKKLANARQAKLVKKAQLWRWASPWVRKNRSTTLSPWLRPWPIRRPRTWLTDINRIIDDEFAQQVKQSIQRGILLGDNTWRNRIAKRLGLDITLRPRGRPRKESIYST